MEKNFRKQFERKKTKNVILAELKGIKDRIYGDKAKLMENYERIGGFAKELIKKYGREKCEKCEKCELFDFLISSTPPPGFIYESFDLDENIEKFLRNF